MCKTADRGKWTITMKKIIVKILCMTKVILQIKRLWEETYFTNGLGQIYLINMTKVILQIKYAFQRLSCCPIYEWFVRLRRHFTFTPLFLFRVFFPSIYMCSIYTHPLILCLNFVLHFLYYTSESHLTLTWFSSFTIHAWCMVHCSHRQPNPIRLQ